MNAKKLSVSIFLILCILFGAIFAIVYDKTDSVDIIGNKLSYAEQYASKNNINFKAVTASDKYFEDSVQTGINIADFTYIFANGGAEIVGYNGSAKEVIIPIRIEGKKVNAISFDVVDTTIETIIIPDNVTRIECDFKNGRYDLTFLIGMLIAFVGTAVAVIFVLTLKVENKEKMLLTVSQFWSAYLVAVLSIILSGIYLFVPKIPDVVVYIGMVAVYAIAVISIVKAKTAVKVVTEVEEKVKVKTFFIKSLTVDAECLMNATKSAELKALAKKVYEAIRYSDPMSNAALVETEDKIQSKFNAFEIAVKAEDFDIASSTSEELLSLIDIRNKKCKLLK